VFQENDVLALLHEILAHPSANDVHLPKFQSLWASRACRSAVMIGDCLTTKKMEEIVRNLADLDRPWNCPHGRPTMRHLSDIKSLKICR